MNRKDSCKIEFRNETLEFNLTEDQPVAVIETGEFGEWIDNIYDVKTNARITKDINKMRRGLFGDRKETDGVFELRLDYGPGFRVYYAWYGKIVIILLGGGDKSSQKVDLKNARKLWKELKNEIKEI
ncbi:MAG: type II toxin-antitoxin system RelE/ParE family toxin [Armatimonadota bacterium]